MYGAHAAKWYEKREAAYSLSVCCILRFALHGWGAKISAPSIGVYSYLIGLFTCATCNMSWLISRTLFRKHKPIAAVHIAVAVAIAGLIMFNQTWHYLVSIDVQVFPESQFMWRLKQVWPK